MVNVKENVCLNLDVVVDVTSLTVVLKDLRKLVNFPMCKPLFINKTR